MYMSEKVAQELHNFWLAVKASGEVTNVLGWYQERQIQFPMLAWFYTMIFSIPPSQAENEREFYLTGVFTGARRERMLVDMLPKIIFIKGVQLTSSSTTLMMFFRYQLRI